MAGSLCDGRDATLRRPPAVMGYQRKTRTAQRAAPTSRSARDGLNQGRFFRQQACEIDLADLGGGFVAVPVRAQHRGMDRESRRRECAPVGLNAGISLERVAELSASQPGQREQASMRHARGLALQQIGGKPLDRLEFSVLSVFSFFLSTFYLRLLRNHEQQSCILFIVLYCRFVRAT